MMSSNAADSVFVYTGDGGTAVPQDVVRLRVDPSVASIPAYAFFKRKKLTEVALCEGLVEIGDESFKLCDPSITKINIPITLRRINDGAFYFSVRCPILLHDGIESIGVGAFRGCIFTNFRVPLLITVIPNSMLNGCTSLFSVEIPLTITEIEDYAFQLCHCLRNMAFPPNAVFGIDIFIKANDLLLLFRSEKKIIRKLQHRFDRLPIHSLVYYQSYNQGVLQNLIAAINMRSGQFRMDPSGNQQDCLGMTPLHILACSSVHDLEVYRLIVEKYPTNLITEDRWGALPLLYAFWGAAPAEIIQFLLESHRLHFPDHAINWTMIVKTMGRCDTPIESIENMLNVKQMHFPEQLIEWVYLLGKFAKPSKCTFSGVPFHERMRFLFTCGVSDRVKTLAFKVWRDHITNMIHTACFVWGSDNSVILHEIQAKVAHFENELLQLKEVTTIIELALWKLRINENCLLQEEATHCQKKVKTDESSIIRTQYRITCGADVIIRHVLPFLISVVD